MFPTHVGMNRDMNIKKPVRSRVPHTRGDEPRKTCDIIILMGARRVEVSPTYSVKGGPALTAIYPRRSEAKISCDIGYIFQSKSFSRVKAGLASTPGQLT